MKRRRGQVLECGRCRLIINRQLNASINLYLRMEGKNPCLNSWKYVKRLLDRGGVTWLEIT